MKKEIIIAILLGLSLGLFITYGIYRSNNTGQNTDINLEQALQATPGIEALSTLVIHSPEDESISADSSITIAGDTEPDNFVVILINDEPLITTADPAGAFSVAAELESGSNVILVYSVDEDGNQTVEERTVIFSTASLTGEDEQASPSASPSN